MIGIPNIIGSVILNKEGMKESLPNCFILADLLNHEESDKAHKSSCVHTHVDN